jgi:NADPH:quinone reductase-like Zn-dependent oxidoreductase
MRAAISRSGSQPLEIIEIPSRPIRAHEIRVKVHAIGVNPVDWKMREGGPLRMMRALVGPFGPFVVGQDFAGEVIELGTKVTELKLGERVVGGTNFSRNQQGAYAEEVIVQRDQVAVLPSSVSYEQAAALPVPASTAWIALKEHQSIGPGQKVLVLGASGGVGLATIQLAKMLGAEAFGVCSTRNVALVESSGAKAIDYTKGDPLEAAKAFGPFDLILHAIGTSTYPLAACRALLTPKGIVDLVVVEPGDVFALATSKNVNTLLGVPTRARLEPVVLAVSQGAYKPLIEERFSLADAEKAHVRSKSGKVVGKLIVLPQ